MSNPPITTVLSAAASYDLTTLATVKDELSLTTTDTANDTWLSRAISQVSKAVTGDTKRVFAPEYVQDLFDIRRARYQVPNGQRVLQLSRWPVLAITSVVITLVGETPATLTLVENTDFRVDYATGKLYRLNSDTGLISAWEALPITVRYSAGYGAAVKETHTVPGSPYQVTVTGSTTFSSDQTVSYASGALLSPVASGPTVGQYTVTTGGQYTFAAADTGQVLTFAYTTLSIPNDLADAALQLITARFKAKGRDPALVQRDTHGIGSERFWFGGAPGQKGMFPPNIDALLDNYREPVVA